MNLTHFRENNSTKIFSNVEKNEFQEDSVFFLEKFSKTDSEKIEITEQTSDLIIRKGHRNSTSHKTCPPYGNLEN